MVSTLRLSTYTEVAGGDAAWTNPSYCCDADEATYATGSISNGTFSTKYTNYLYCYVPAQFSGGTWNTTMCQSVSKIEIGYRTYFVGTSGYNCYGFYYWGTTAWPNWGLLAQPGNSIPSWDYSATPAWYDITSAVDSYISTFGGYTRTTIISILASAKRNSAVKAGNKSGSSTIHSYMDYIRITWIPKAGGFFNMF